MHHIYIYIYIFIIKKVAFCALSFGKEVTKALNAAAPTRSAHSCSPHPLFPILCCPLAVFFSSLVSKNKPGTARSDDSEAKAPKTVRKTGKEAKKPAALSCWEGSVNPASSSAARQGRRAWHNEERSPGATPSPGCPERRLGNKLSRNYNKPPPPPQNN